MTGVWESDLSFDRPCTINNFGYFKCPNNLTCGNIDSYLEISFESEHYEEREYLNYDVTSFSNLGTSLLTVFQMITSETWSQQLFNLMDVDTPFIGGIYCFAVIIIGQFFVMNLILAVIIEAFMLRYKLKLQN